MRPLVVAQLERSGHHNHFVIALVGPAAAQSVTMTLLGAADGDKASRGNGLVQGDPEDSP